MARPRVNFECGVSGCASPASAKGYCVSHYRRFYKYGSAAVPLRHVGKHNLLGQMFGRLTVIKRAPSKNGQSRWVCRCQCDQEPEVSGGHLVNGDSTSCGCAGVKHGHARRDAKSATYQAWSAMKDRCFRPANKHYARYGGRGITVCERWMAYENFLADMGEVPDGLTLERRDNNGNYEPGNCYWATLIEQMNNQNKTIRIEFQGQVKSLGTWAREYGMARTTLSTRLRRGWTVERAITEPVAQKDAKTSMRSGAGRWRSGRLRREAAIVTQGTIYRQLKRADAKRIQCMRCGQRARVCRTAYWLAGSRKGVSFFYLCDECVCSDFEMKTRRIVLRNRRKAA